MFKVDLYRKRTDNPVSWECFQRDRDVDVLKGTKAYLYYLQMHALGDSLAEISAEDAGVKYVIRRVNE